VARPLALAGLALLDAWAMMYVVPYYYHV